MLILEKATTQNVEDHGARSGSGINKSTCSNISAETYFSMIFHAILGAVGPEALVSIA